jgi:hypothetical protein
MSSHLNGIYPNKVLLAWVEKQSLEDREAYQRSVVELQEHGLMGSKRD